MILEGFNAVGGRIQCDIFKRSAARAGSIDLAGANFFEFAGQIPDQIFSMSTIEGGTSTSWSLRTSKTCHIEGLYMINGGGRGIDILEGLVNIDIVNCRIDNVTSDRIRSDGSVSNVLANVHNCVLSQGNAAKSIADSITGDTGNAVCDYNIRETLGAGEIALGANSTQGAVGFAALEADGRPTLGGNCDGTGNSSIALKSGLFTPIPGNTLQIYFDGRDYLGDSWLSNPLNRNIGAAAGSEAA
jgi:hypothetical protein